MSMSKQDYEMVAQALGKVLGERLDLPRGDSAQTEASAILERMAVRDCVQEFILAEMARNQRFNPEVFRNRVEEIAQARAEELREALAEAADRA